MKHTDENNLLRIEKNKKYMFKIILNTKFSNLGAMKILQVKSL